MMRSKIYGDNYLKMGATELIIQVEPSGEMLVFCQPWVKLLRLYIKGFIQIKIVT